MSNKTKSRDNMSPALFSTSLLPVGAGVIYRPARSAMTSGRRRTKHWILRFERRRPQYIEPLMGSTADDDPVADVELRFDSLRSAIRYAERQGLSYRVQSRVMHQQECGGRLMADGEPNGGIEDARYP
jgi:hypothetical protein